jgi:hypothetical protein
MTRRLVLSLALILAWSGLAWAQAVGPAPDGSAVVGNPVRIGGKDGAGVTRDLATDASGRVKIDGAGSSPLGVSASSLPLPTGAATETTLGTRALESGGNLAAGAASLDVLDDWDEGDRAKVNLIPGQEGIAAGSGAVGATVPRVTLATGDGATWHYLPSAASTNATNVKNAAGTIHAMWFVNLNAAVRYIRFYNTSSAPTCSSATGFVASVPIPADPTGAGIAPPLGPHGIAFSTGISYCITTGPANNDNNAVAANEIFISITYK